MNFLAGRNLFCFVQKTILQTTTVPFPGSTSSPRATSSRAPATLRATARWRTASGHWRGQGGPTSFCRWESWDAKFPQNKGFFSLAKKPAYRKLGSIWVLKYIEGGMAKRVFFSSFRVAQKGGGGKGRALKSLLREPNRSAYVYGLIGVPLYPPPFPFAVLERRKISERRCARTLFLSL